MVGLGAATGGAGLVAGGEKEKGASVVAVMAVREAAGMAEAVAAARAAAQCTQMEGLA